MVILVGGLASSPIFSSIGNAFAQTDEDEERDNERDSAKYYDKRCWETNTGELRCEGHDGKCVKTDAGIQCEVEHDYTRDIKIMLDKYCQMTDEERDAFLAEHDYFREHHERLANYCAMSEDERKDYREAHQDMMMDFKDKRLDMVDEMKDKHQDTRMQKMMEKHGEITDERMDKLIDKYRMHHDDFTDEQIDTLRDEIRDKYSDHYKMKFKARHDALTDQRKADLLTRHAEMKAYKEELRERYNDMTDEEREQYRMDFIQKAKDVRFAWLSPHKQMLAGISVDEIECREGLNLVMMNSNGKVMCMKSSTAEKLIERDIVVPAL